ncbi:MAG: hypothetical protein EOP49_07530 [Sphingobacteriales bacterium]|nr:MAG: hypothetical protein EOP49_07530 [Sphingobacteriales bacterium]
MRTIKLYSEATVYEENAQQSRLTRSGVNLINFFLSYFKVNRNNVIEKRINKIRASAIATPWHMMTEQQRINYIYRKMAEEKAIERMTMLKN